MLGFFKTSDNVTTAVGVVVEVVGPFWLNSMGLRSSTPPEIMSDFGVMAA